jgi:hypothetical protein
MPKVNGRLLLMEHIEARGIDLSPSAYDRDLEGVVGEWTFAGTQCSNPDCPSWRTLQPAGLNTDDWADVTSRDPRARRRN